MVHCGHDCIPWDLSVLGMHTLAQSRNAELVEASTFTELPAETAASGGTLTTAVYQLGKTRGGAAKPDFDPLLRSPDGSKSEFATKITRSEIQRYPLAPVSSRPRLLLSSPLAPPLLAHHPSHRFSSSSRLQPKIGCLL